MNRLHIQGCILLLTVFLATSLQAQDLQMPRPSPDASVSQTIGVSEIAIRYSRPGVKDRVIWGGLVPYDKVWRTGANEATNITTPDDILVEGKKLPAGSYSIATIPGKETWTIIFNKRDDLWGTFGYRESEDVLRISVKPQPAPFKERLQFTFANLTDTSTDVVFHWEKVKVSFRIEIDTRGIALQRAKTAISWRDPLTAATYCLRKNDNLELALRWSEISVLAEKNYWNLRVKARLQEKLGQKEEAIATMSDALGLGEKMDNAPFDFDRMKALLEDWKK